MNKKQLWRVFLAIMTSIALWFSFQSGYKIYYWLSRSAKTPPISIDWEVKKEGNDRFILSADYIFSFNGQKIKGHTTFSASKYRSAQTAEHFLAKQTEKQWVVWFSPSIPQRSTLNRFFPLKSCIYTAIVWCILVYFVWLGYRLRNHHQ